MQRRVRSTNILTHWNWGQASLGKHSTSRKKCRNIKQGLKRNYAHVCTFQSQMHFAGKRQRKRAMFWTFSQCEQVYQVVLIFQRFHEMFLWNATICILFKLVEETLKKDTYLQLEFYRLPVLIHYKTENHSQSPQIVFIKWKPLPLWWFPHRSSARNVRRVLWSPVSPEDQLFS